MKRLSLINNGLTLSYLDSGNSGEPLIALHGHWMEAQTFAPLEDCLTPDWRLIALDQRGHGYSDHAQSYWKEDYLCDLDALFAHLGIARAALLGHSLGGVNAYQFAVRHPERVEALIIEDIGPTVYADVGFVRSWSGVFQTKQELEARIDIRLLPFLRDSFRSDAEGWHLAFDPNDMVNSQENLNGDHWRDWLASKCAALVIRGEQSNITTQAEMEQMVRMRPNTRLVSLPGGHVVHLDSPGEFCREISSFLRSVTL